MSAKASGTLSGNKRAVVRFEVDVPGLYVRRVSFGSDHELSSAVFGVHPQGDDGKDIRIEQVWRIVKKGQRVKVSVQRGNDTTKQTIFHGWIVVAGIRASGRFEDLEYTAMGLDWGLKVEKVFGSWCRDSKAQNALWLRGTFPVFNKDGKPNRHANRLRAKPNGLENESFDRDTFDLDDDFRNPKVVHWYARDMVRYLVLSERKGQLSSQEGRVFDPTRDYGGELEDLMPYDVNVEGEDAWDGLVKVAARCSRGVTVRYDNDRSKTDLRFFTKQLDEARDVKQIELPGATLKNVKISDETIVVSSIDVHADLSGIVRQVDAVAPPKLFEEEWDLHSGWKKEDEDAAFGDGDIGKKIANFLAQTDPERSDDWEKYKFVGRRFILNETGRDDDCDTVGKTTKGLEGSTTGDKDPYNFGRVFNEDFTPRNRPFRHQRVEKGRDGAPLPVRVRVQWSNSLVEDDKLGHNVELLHDRAGIYFKGGPLVNVPVAIKTGDVKKMFPDGVSLQAVVEGDDAAPSGVYGISSSEDMPVPTFGLVRVDDGLRVDNKNAEVVDDIRAKAQKMCDDAVSELGGERLVGTVVTPWVTFAFDVGDVIDRVNGRNLKIKAQIAKVTHDAVNQATELALHYPDIDTSTHAHHSQPKTEEHWERAKTSAGLSVLGRLFSLVNPDSGYPERALAAAVERAEDGGTPSEVEHAFYHSLAPSKDAPQGKSVMPDRGPAQ